GISCRVKRRRRSSRRYESWPRERHGRFDHGRCPAGQWSFHAKPLPVPDQPILRYFDPLFRIGDNPADDPSFALVVVENVQDRIHPGFVDDHAEPDPHIIDFEHFGITDLSMMLNHSEYFWRRWQIVDAKPGLLTGNTRQVQEAVAGNVDQRLDLW